MRFFETNKLILIFLFLFSSTFSFANDWKRVYLATYPRSGNHWVRMVVEEATGIATGSVYRDYPTHTNTVFDWGGYSTDHGYTGNCRYPTIQDIVLIKTHCPCLFTQFDNQPAIKTIRIVRNPIDSLFSFKVYMHNLGHLPDKIMTKQYVSDKIAEFKKFNDYWNNKPNVYTVRYEDMLKCPVKCLKKILAEIGYHVSVKDIKNALKKYPSEGSELKHIGEYSDELIEMIKSELKGYLDQFNYHIP